MAAVAMRSTFFCCSGRLGPSSSPSTGRLIRCGRSVRLSGSGQHLSACALCLVHSVPTSFWLADSFFMCLALVKGGGAFIAITHLLECVLYGCWHQPLLHASISGASLAYALCGTDYPSPPSPMHIAWCTPGGFQYPPARSLSASPLTHFGLGFKCAPHSHGVHDRINVHPARSFVIEGFILAYLSTSGLGIVQMVGKSIHLGIPPLLLAGGAHPSCI